VDPSGVVVRPASTVIACRPGSGTLEVLMVRRASGADFLGGAHVFPGGGVDELDRSTLAARAVDWGGDPEEFAWRAAALRELAEESGIALTDRPVEVEGLRGEGVFEAVLDAGAVLLANRLEYLSNWVTPIGPPRRYDTRFFVVAVPDATRSISDGVEVFDATWVSPGDALAQADSGGWYVEFPTRRHLEMLARFSDPAAVLGHARSATPVKIEPRLVVDAGGSWRVLIPGDTGFEEAAS
jgi:8-oxo-dGTP pyrophosphatase MutT (NUDIX family)